MGLCLGRTSPHPPTLSPRWPDLPPDLAGLILCRLTSPTDHLRFGAVCRDWRLAAQQQQQGGAAPWLNVGPGAYQSLDGKVHSFTSCHGSSGNWIVCYRDDQPKAGRYLFLRNPFHASVAPIKIPWPCREPPKIVMCTSSSVAILHRGVCTMAPFWPADMTGPPPEHRTWLPLAGDYVDIAFYRGKFFAVTQSGELFSHDLLGRRCEHVINQSFGAYDHQAVGHLVVSADKKKLLMVRWSIHRRNAMVDHRKSILLGRKTMVRRSAPRRKVMGVVVHHEHRWVTNLQVFEADLAKGRWLEVKDLESQALFISRSCCRAIGSPQGNCVYIHGVDWHLKRIVPDGSLCKCRSCSDDINGVPSYCVYDMMNRTASLVSLGGGRNMESARSEWFFPCE